MKYKLRLKLMPYRRYLTLACLIAFFMLLYAWQESNRIFLYSHYPFARSGYVQVAECPMSGGHLERLYDLSSTSEVVYYKQRIRTRASDYVDREEVLDIPTNTLFDHRQILDLDHPCEDWYDMPYEPVELDVPFPYPKRQYSEFMFGVATSFERLIDSIPQFSHWLSGSGARLVVVVVDLAEHIEDLGYLASLFKTYDIEVAISGPYREGLGVNEQHFTVIHDMLRHVTPTTKWLGIIDDDTFFPSLYPLAEIMEDQDHNGPAYLGGLSDSLVALQQHGLMGYGGAGAFLSVPLARQLDPLIEDCISQSNIQQGDALLKYCISSQTNTTLTLIPGLNQQDFMGNPDGFYESGNLPISLHHWKSWHRAPVDQIAKTSTFCGDCLLQRWHFGEYTVLTNGYSIAVYEDGITTGELAMTEGTFDNPHMFEWSLGPLRAKAEDGLKKTYHLVESELLGATGLRQLYLYRAPDHGVEDGSKVRDEVIEILWER